MAGLQQPSHAPSIVASTSGRDKASPRRALPNGPCNHRDPAGLLCGCTQFWDRCSADLHESSASQRSTWCVCTHHACFHSLQAPTPPETCDNNTIGQGRASSACDGRCQLRTGSQCGAHARPRNAGPASHPHSGRLALYGGHPRTSQITIADDRSLQHTLPSANSALVSHDAAKQVSQRSASPVPSIPSVCLLSEDRALFRNDRAVATGTTIGHASPASNRLDRPAGLGLSLFDSQAPQSMSPTIIDEVNRFQHLEAVGLPSTRANSMREESVRKTPPPPRGGSLDAVLEFNRSLRLNVDTDTVPNTVNPEDYTQSATEVATPSEANTPDLAQTIAVIERNLPGCKATAEMVTQMIVKRRMGQSPTPAGALSKSATATSSHSQLQQAIMEAPPQVIERLESYLKPLHAMTHTLPFALNPLKELPNRVDRLECEKESLSFTHIPFEVQQQLEMQDGRILELEHWKDEHDALHRHIDADQSSHSTKVHESFGSNQSTSSVVVVARREYEALVDRVDMAEKRLDMAEAALPPSMGNPWEIEVVVLPWGPELRGIWFAPDQPMHDAADPLTQDSEDWTQGMYLTQRLPSSQATARRKSGPGSNGKASLTSSLNFSETESGWSSQAISDWAAGDVDEWLWPKACGSNSLVYKRLQSRGFIRHVTLTSPNARSIQRALSSAFADLFEHFRFSEGEEDTAIHAYPALRAPFIPLRKFPKDKRLRFLARSEMANAARWDAQFLSGDVMMRVPGGKKRLYVTQRESYVQQKDEDDDLLPMEEPSPKRAWTWQSIRELPRFQEPGSDSQMEGNEATCDVPEADAKEACWAFHGAFDTAPASVSGSVNSSFNSHHSAQIELSVRPAGRDWRRSMTPSSILKNKPLQPPQPLSPQSEYPQLRPGSRRRRTNSSSMADPAPLLSSGKRRLNSPTKQEQGWGSHPQYSARPSSIVSSRPKRRRVTSSPPCRDPEANVPIHAPEEDGDAQVWNQGTVRRAGALPSPLYSSQPRSVIRRTSSNLTKGSQRSSNVGGRRATPSAYATPYSGPVQYAYSDVGGDTEPDSDGEGHNGLDTGAGAESDGELSWRGVDDDEENELPALNTLLGSQTSSPSSSSAVESGAEGDDSGFASDNDDNPSDSDSDSDSDGDDDDDLDELEAQEDAFDFGTQQAQGSSDQVLEHLLYVIDPTDDYI